MNQLNLDDFVEVISQEKFKSQFIEMQELGSGSGSNVYSAFDIQKKIQVAIKIYNKTQLRKQSRIDVIRQVQILKKICSEDSDYFVKFYHAYKVQKQFQLSYYCVIEEKCIGSLQGLIKSAEFQAQPQSDKRKLCLHISQCIQVLHNTHSIMHRDLKPANFLMTIRNGQIKPVLSDFGHSKEYQEDIANTTFRGSLKYVNPNIISSEDSLLKYSFEFDVYSLGIIFLQILTNKFLFQISKMQANSPIKFVKRMSQQLEKAASLLDNNQSLKKEQKCLIENCLTNVKYTIIQVVYDLKTIIVGEQDKKDSNKFTKNKHHQYMQTQLVKDQTIYEKEAKNEVTTFQTESNSEEVEQKYIEVDEAISDSEKMIVSSCKVDSKINNLKKNQKICSDICISSINNQQVVAHENQKISGISSQPQLKIQKQKSLYLQRLQSAQQKLNIKIGTSNADKIPKAISTFLRISANLDKNSRSLEELEKLRKFEESFKKIQQIEYYSRIGLNERKKLVIFALRYLIKKIQLQCNAQKKENSYTEQYTKSYLKRLREIKQKAINQFLEDYGDKLGQKRIKLLKQEKTSLQEIREQFENIAKNLNISEMYSQLKHVIDW